MTHLTFEVEFLKIVLRDIQSIRGGDIWGFLLNQ